MPGVNSRSYSITLGAIPGLRGTGNFSHRTANHWPEQGIRASTKVGPRLGLRGEIANAHHAGFSAAIGDAAYALGEGRLAVRNGGREVM